MKKFEVPNGELRFVTRPNGNKILQQRWRIPQVVINPMNGEKELDYEFEWRDVPLLMNDPGKYS